MDTTPPRTGPPPNHLPPGGLFAWLRGLDIVRSGDRWFTGVAGGIAAKAGIDPLIVRGVFVVLAVLGGPGLLLYLAGWMLLPDAAGRIHLEEVVRGRAETWVIVTGAVLAAVVVLPVALRVVLPGLAVFPAVDPGGWELWERLGVPSWLTAATAWAVGIGILVVGAIWLQRAVIAHGRERHAGPPDPSAAAEPANAEDERHAAAPPTPGGSPPESAADRGRRAGEAAAQWGQEVGARATEWSARYAEQHDARRLGAGHTVFTLALALLAAGGAASWALVSGSALGSPIPGDSSGAILTALVAALAVCALSVIVAGVRGRRTGWVGALSAGLVGVLLVTAVLPWGSRVQPVGRMQVDGASAPGALLVGGTMRIDLRDLDDRRDRHELDAVLLAGTAELVLPERHPVVVQVRVLAGAIDEPAGQRSGAITGGPLITRTLTANLRSGQDPDTASRVTVTVLAGVVRVPGISADTPRDRELERAR